MQDAEEAEGERGQGGSHFSSGHGSEAGPVVARWSCSFAISAPLTQATRPRVLARNLAHTAALPLPQARAPQRRLPPLRRRRPPSPRRAPPAPRPRPPRPAPPTPAPTPAPRPAASPLSLTAARGRRSARGSSAGSLRSCGGGRPRAAARQVGGRAGGLGLGKEGRRGSSFHAMALQLPSTVTCALLLCPLSPEKNTSPLGRDHSLQQTLRAPADPHALSCRPLPWQRRRPHQALPLRAGRAPAVACSVHGAARRARPPGPALLRRGGGSSRRGARQDRGRTGRRGRAGDPSAAIPRASGVRGRPGHHCLHGSAASGRGGCGPLCRGCGRWAGGERRGGSGQAAPPARVQWAPRGFRGGPPPGGLAAAGGRAGGAGLAQERRLPAPLSSGPGWRPRPSNFGDRTLTAVRLEWE